MKTEKRYIYWIGSIAAVFLVWQLAVVPLRSALNRLDRRIRKKEESLEQIRMLGEEYVFLKGAGLAGSVSADGQRTEPLTVIEKLSRQMRVDYDLTYEESGEDRGGDAQTRVSVELNGVDMKQLLRYLYAMKGFGAGFGVGDFLLVRREDGLLKVSFEILRLSGD